VSDVTRPTITVYSPKRKNTGAAVVVFPGGGYQTLAIDVEGMEVREWLTPKGIMCVQLKYLVTDVGPYPKSGPHPESPMALEVLTLLHLVSRRPCLSTLAPTTCRSSLRNATIGVSFDFSPRFKKGCTPVAELSKASAISRT